MEENKAVSNPVINWLFRFFKGMCIGTGFILPGVSGGVLATIFGVYERMIRFFAHITRDFFKNLRFFLPIGAGAVVCIILVSKLLDKFFKVAETQLIWFFIGCVVGTVPLLFAQAGKKGRKLQHIFLFLGVTVFAYFLLFNLKHILSGITIPTDNIFTWLLAGALMGLGAIVPGLSPSNFLVYLNMYEPLTEGMGDLNLMVLIPTLAGAALCFLLLSKGINYLFEKAYTGLFHSILGVIAASTLMIIPINVPDGSVFLKSFIVDADFPAGFSYLSLSGGICLLTFISGAALGYIMGILEKKYKAE